MLSNFFGFKSTKQIVDTIINPEWIIPIIPKGKILKETSIILKNGLIHDILPTKEAQTRYTTKNKKQNHFLKNQAVIPGLINGHVHTAMTLLRGYADDYPLEKWLFSFMFPAEKEFMNEEFVRDGTRIGIAEMIRTGTTTAIDMYDHPNAIVEATKQTGIRMAVSYPIHQIERGHKSENSEELFFRQFKHNPLIFPIYGPHSTYTVPENELKRITATGERITIHLHETKKEVENFVNKHGIRPVEFLRKMGMLNSNCITVHMTQLLDSEIKLLAQTQTTVAHCPQSNMKLCSGICRVQDLLDSGVNVCLGTDGTASNNDLDMFDEMKTASLLGKIGSNKPDALTAQTVLEMATINGAKALGKEDLIGSVTKGKMADLVSVDLYNLQSQPVYDPISQIVYCGNGQRVSNVWVAGQQLLSNKVLCTIDLKDCFKLIKKWQKKISRFRNENLKKIKEKENKTKK
ncbi:aminohydrolase ssna-related [Anaeramoeba ignava]|uniref:Aminohydrolase ssna-related n=1 Tax=Anaeramoeba ignava TaxID=1746090 RepID=A0A9Q0R9Z3_ANAIG|nr:aminohydrolase ssna-related [Anaeramoeba ignava]